MLTRVIRGWIPVWATLLVAVACGSDDEGSESEGDSAGTAGRVTTETGGTSGGSGGTAVIGGRTGTGGVAPNGGTSTQGGAVEAGGVQGLGGRVTSGGSSGLAGVPAAGGSVANGGDEGSGGAPATGGSPTTGGAETAGGHEGNGGASANGGLEIDGGSPGDGGNSGEGGAVAGGGMQQEGGSPDDGGSPANGGVEETGGSGTGGSDPGDDWYPCDGPASDYDATAILSDGSWMVQNGGQTLYTGSDMQQALSAAYGSLTSGRTSKESILVQGSGDISADAQLRIPGYTILNLCGTINVTGSATQSDRSPLYARGVTDIDIPHASVTGNAQYAMFFRQVSRLHLGRIDVRLNASDSGIGIRIDNNPSAGGAMVTDIAIDAVYAETTGSHGVETYGVDGFTLGRLDGSNLGECGVLLNQSVNAEIGTVHCENCAEGTGYAAFRMANRNGRIGDAYPENIHVGEVYARGGGRGIFCVSESGGAVIDRIDVADTGNNAILLENCYNVTIAAESGRVEGPGDVRIAARSEFANSSDITFSNLTFVDTALNEDPCGTNTQLVGNVFEGSADNSCN